MNKIKTVTTIFAASAVCLAGAQAQQYNAGDFSAGIGFMERSDTAFGYLKANKVMSQNGAFSHKLGLEYLGYSETLSTTLGTDLRYHAIVLNYELDYEVSKYLSFSVGAGGGAQFVDLDSPVGSLDDDIAGYAQVYAGATFKLTENASLRIGVRRMFFDEHDLLGVSGLKQEQTWGFDVGVTVTF